MTSAAPEIKPNTLVVRRLRLDPAYRAKEAERRRRYKANEHTAAQIRRSSPDGWAKNRLISIRHKAKGRNLAFDITWEDLVPPTMCPVFGTPLFLTRKGTGYKADPNSASVDRIDNNLGYVKGNVRVISNRANLLKKDACVSELRMLADWLEKELNK